MLKRVLGNHGFAAAAIVTPDGDYGQVLLSRSPMTNTEVHDISVPGHEPRRAITAIIDAPPGRFFVLATHLGLKFVERRRQCTQLSILINRCEVTIVAMGDWMWHGSVQAVLPSRLPGRTQHRTFPARFPPLKLDRIYCRPAQPWLRAKSIRQVPKFLTICLSWRRSAFRLSRRRRHAAHQS